jgi:hypothetical protein
MKTILRITIIVLFFPLVALSQKIEYVTNDFCWIFLNMNNSMSIEAGDIPFSEIKINTSDKQTIEVNTEGKFRLRTNSGRITLKAYRYKGKDSTFICERTFEVKPLPKPTASIGKSWHDSQMEMHKEAFLAQQGIAAPLINYDFNIRFPVKSFTIIVTRENELVYLKDYEGSRFSAEMKKELNVLLKGGERVFFTNIKIGSDFHYNKFTNSIELRIKKQE